VAVLVAALREHLDEQLLSSVEAHVETQASVGGFRSYQDVLLSMGVPLVGQDTSNAIGLNLNWHMRYRLSNQHRSTTLSPPASLKPTMNPDEGWQVIKPHRVRRCVPSAAPRPAASRSYSPLYLAVVEGKCLNYLSSSHRRADCCLPTCCFYCHGFWHHLRDCKRPRKSSLALEVPEAASQVPRGTLPSLGDKEALGAPALSHLVLRPKLNAFLYV
jgi:hypothetical protein